MQAVASTLVERSHACSNPDLVDANPLGYGGDVQQTKCADQSAGALQNIARPG
jgi:hypothetical protein